MFKSRQIPVIIDKKARINVAECLYFYIIAPHRDCEILTTIEPFVSKEKYESKFNIVKALSEINYHTS